MVKRQKKKLSKLYTFRLHHKVMFSLIGVIGVILVWRGMWTFFDSAPIINHPIVSVILGFTLLALSGFFFKLL